MAWKTLRTEDIDLLGYHFCFRSRLTEDGFHAQNLTHSDPEAPNLRCLGQSSIRLEESFGRLGDCWGVTLSPQSLLGGWRGCLIGMAEYQTSGAIEGILLGLLTEVKRQDNLRRNT